MATHDYVIDNSTGANVRADINLVLQAILTNNSSSSAPSTTAAYMWWADTTNGVLKIRNSANNAWIELFQLDGTLTLEDGSAGTPALAFRDDLDTGIFSGGANQLEVSTGGTERLMLSNTSTVFNQSGADTDFRIESDSNTHAFFLDAGNNRVGISTSSPDTLLHLAGADTAIIRLENSDNSLVADQLIGGLEFEKTDPSGAGAGVVGGVRMYSADSVGASTYLAFSTSSSSGNNVEAYRIDDIGRVLVRGQSAFTSTSLTHRLQVKAQNDGSAIAVIGRNGDHIATHSFYQSDGSTLMGGFVVSSADFAIRGEANIVAIQTSGGNERARFTSGGNLGIGVTSPGATIDLVRGGNECIRMENTTGVRLRMMFHDYQDRDGEIEMHTGDFKFSLESGGSLSQVFRLDHDTTFHYGNQDILDPANNNSVGISGRGSLGFLSLCRDSDIPLVVGIKGSDGQLIRFIGQGTIEGNISISGSTVSFNGGHLSRWSQIKGISTTDKSARPTIYQGTVMSNLDDLCVWSYPDQLYTEQDKTDGIIPEGKDVGDLKKAAHTEENQQLNMTKISDTEGDKDVAGVFWTWDDANDDYYVNDYYVAMTGDMVIRVAGSTTVARGDLMISAGDGTAKPQTDDIIRSSTIAKIISTNATATYADGSKAYPCVLMAC
tara:strand:- start:692 stop:2680 length:1989 start_codon:yes stop_codon:yes gene_type:complete